MKTNKQYIFLVAIMAFGLLLRLIPHLPNFSPVLGVALFAGVYFKNKWFAPIIPLGILLATDVYLGFYSEIAFVYIPFLITVVLGFALRKRLNPFTLFGFSILSSVMFFIISNLGTFLLANIYPQTVAGLTECYTLAIPFFRNAILGDLFFTFAIFGFYELVKYGLPKLTFKTAQ
jgi:hypothetical protein